MCGTGCGCTNRIHTFVWQTSGRPADLSAEKRTSADCGRTLKWLGPARHHCYSTSGGAQHGLHASLEPLCVKHVTRCLPLNILQCGRTSLEAHYTRFTLAVPAGALAPERAIGHGVNPPLESAIAAATGLAARACPMVCINLVHAFLDPVCIVMRACISCCSLDPHSGGTTHLDTSAIDPTADPDHKHSTT